MSDEKDVKPAQHFSVVPKYGKNDLYPCRRNRDYVSIARKIPEEWLRRIEEEWLRRIEKLHDQG